jgi:anti-sigma regulatory factor (Ser/Thr protein kinase)
LPATLDGVADLHLLLQQFWLAIERAVLGAGDQGWRAAFETAVIEIGTNIARHAYPRPSGTETMQITLRGYSDRVEAVFCDRGIPLKEPPPSSPLESVDLLDLPESGIGLEIARAAVDRVEYERTADGSNLWLLVKQGAV